MVLKRKLGEMLMLESLCEEIRGISISQKDEMEGLMEGVKRVRIQELPLESVSRCENGCGGWNIRRLGGLSEGSGGVYCGGCDEWRCERGCVEWCKECGMCEECCKECTSKCGCGCEKSLCHMDTIVCSGCNVEWIYDHSDFWRYGYCEECV